ncbi:MAG TPA: hypothetical protein VL860_12570 [Planctomycetota bacterium]|nr:hypothetical protein [Planctomycetota bacterium]
MKPEWLEQCRENFGRAPRELPFRLRMTYLRVKRPEWIEGDRNFTALFDNMKRVLLEGDVVWGHLVQANRLLFAPGEHDSPAVVVHPHSPAMRVDLNRLAQVAHLLYELKDTDPREIAQKEIAAYITDERARTFGRPVPKSISPLIPCLMSTLQIPRHHLPNGVLSQSLFPVVMSPAEPRYVMVLPSRFWPPEMAMWWERG